MDAFSDNVGIFNCISYWKYVAINPPVLCTTPPLQKEDKNELLEKHIVFAK